MGSHQPQWRGALSRGVHLKKTLARALSARWETKPARTALGMDLNFNLLYAAGVARPRMRNDVGLFEAWGNWGSGESLANLHLWGLRIVWWGRIGKLLEFAAGLVLLIDIVGPKRLKAFGQWLRTQATAKETLRFAFGTLRWAKAQVLSWVESRHKRALRVWNEDRSLRTDLVSHTVQFVLALLLTFPLMRIIFDLESWTDYLIAFIPSLVLAFLAAIPVTVCLIFAWAALGVVVDSLFLKPASWILEYEHASNGFKIASLILFVIGFHFDLLAS
jgi:hypothetical protein